MIQCQNCGQANTRTSNFCRFCGTKFPPQQTANTPNFDEMPPRPYSWKTDEFQADATRVRNRPINQVQPLAAPKPFAAAPQPPPPAPMYQQTQPLVYQQPQPLNFGYNTQCPRCNSQYIRYEKKISTAGWIVFAVLMVTFFPLFWIGLMIKEDARFCQVCNYRVS